MKTTMTTQTRKTALITGVTGQAGSAPGCHNRIAQRRLDDEVEVDPELLN